MRNDLFNPTIVDILASFKLDKVYVKAEGPYLYDESGNCYMDFISQYGAIPFGYNPGFIWEAIERVQREMLPSFVQPSLPVKAMELAERLAELAPGDLCYSTFSQSGTEAVEAAIKLARSSSGKEIIISTHNSFHGKTLGSLSATGKASYQKPFYAPVAGFVQIPFNDTEALKQILAEYDGQVAAFIVEPIQGEGGIVAADEDYLRQTAQICREKQILFILDEIQTGLGRTGSMFLCEQYGIEPDILILAKALGGGMLPLAACISSKAIWNDDFGQLHSSTFANNNITCAVGLAVLDKLCENDCQLIKEVAAKGGYMLDKLNDIASRYPDVIKEIRGRGFMVGVEFCELRDCGSYEVEYITRQEGFTALLCGYLLNVHHLRFAPYLNNSMTLRLEPNLTITNEEIDRVCAALEDICRILHFKNYGLLYKYIIGDNTHYKAIKDYRARSRKVKYSDLQSVKNKSDKFAFIVHYPDPSDIIDNNPSFEQFSREELYEYMNWQNGFDQPDICCYMPAITTKAGATVEGWFIGIPYGAKQLMNMPRQQVVEMIKRAVDKGKELGAGVVGLGALTSVVTKGGRDVVGRGVAITSGNSFTTLMAMEALLKGAAMLNINIEEAGGAVVGASGSIGRACSLLLSQQLNKLCLLGNADRPRSSMKRLNILAADIMNLANSNRLKNKICGMSKWWADVLVNSGASWKTSQLARRIEQQEQLVWNEWEECFRILNQPGPIIFGLDLDEYLPRYNMIVAASNSPEKLIFSKHLSSGTVVCDVARPPDVSAEVAEKRKDVLILEGGLVEFPDSIAFGPNLGYRDGVNMACLVETILLALENRQDDYSIGRQLDFATINYMQELSEKHGFTLAGLLNNKKEIELQAIETVYFNANNTHFQRAK
jgi:acetylornithine/succinyldiaminopimelate/putrescine aminotransferase/predicted amino acid dehydrogenase